jgi:hypothetical protein
LGYGPASKASQEAGALVREIRARPHLGKFCESFSKEDLAKIHGDRFARFLDLVEEYDPERKFTNDFTRRLFGR